MESNNNPSEKDKTAAKDKEEDYVKPQEEAVKKCNVFISYQWKAQLKVKQLYNELASLEPLEIFMDIYKIKAGMNLYLSLASNLQEADVVLACVTREYVNSKNCEREIIYADSFNKQIIPLYLEKIPIKELGSIGFILVRERYCNLYKNEKVFERFKESEEFKDILDGIKSFTLKIKGIEIDLSKMKPLKVENVDEEKIDSEVFRFRNDQPFNLGLTSNSNPPIKKNEIFNDKESIAKVIDSNQAIQRNVVKKKTSNNNNFESQKNGPNDSNKMMINPLEIHPVIKECKYLYMPKSILYPLADRFYTQEKNEKRGGMIYMKPNGWIRFGLKVNSCYPDCKIWLTKDGNPNEWAVAYVGFKVSPLRSLKRRLFDSSDAYLNPTLANSKQMTYVKIEDVNPNSLQLGEPCNIGIICTPNSIEAEKHTTQFIVDNKKYKMILQCRVNPRKVRIPKGTKDLYIINNQVNIRTYGILLKEVN